MEAEFSRLAALLEQDGAKRESIGKEVRDLNRIFRSIQFTLQKVHSVVNDPAAVLAVCQQARAQFAELQPVWKRIIDIVAEENVEKYRAHWRFASEQLVFLAAFTHWLETHQLINLHDTCALIGVGSNETYAVPSLPSAAGSSAPAPALPPGVGLDVDDYLQGLTALPKELCRLCVNAVRAGDYKLPAQISAFVSDLYSGFRLLNLKNDALRRKFDAIKYDVQKIEEVLYDLKVRGLGSNTSAGATAADTQPLATGASASTAPAAGADAAAMQQ